MISNRAGNDAAPLRAQNATLPFLDGARAVAALFVVAHHVYLHPPGQDSGADVYSWRGWEHVWDAFYWGHFAVAFFIVLSGFCLAIAPARRDEMPPLLPFLWRRSLRVLPPYYAALGFSLVLIWLFVGTPSGTHWDVSLPVTVRSLLCRTFLVNALGASDGAINHVFWSIAVEWHLYFLFLPILWLARRFGWLKSLLVVSAISFGAAGVTVHVLKREMSFSFLSLFAWGMAGAYVAFSPRFEAVRSRVPWGVASALAVGVFLFVLEDLPFWNRILPFYQLDFFAGAASALLLVWLCLAPHSWLARYLSQPWLMKIGCISYSLYLVHAPLIQIVWQFGVREIENPQVRFAALMLFSLPLSLAVAWAFFVLFERPFLPRSRRQGHLPPGSSSQALEVSRVHHT